jgi:alpha-tubulin suppressor-like RCC1 family protein
MDSFINLITLVEICDKLTYKDIKILLTINKSFNKIMNEDYFWNLLVNTKFKNAIGIKNNLTWKQLYLKYENPKLYIFGKYRFGVNYEYDNDTVTLIKDLENITQISCGLYHSAIIANGFLYTIGLNTKGELGHSHEHEYKLVNPRRVPDLKNVTYVTCGNNVTGVIADNKLYTFGNNEYGILGHKDINNISIPTLIPNLENPTTIAFGMLHTAIIANGRLYTFGDNKFGQLGHGHKHNLTVPTLVHTLKNVTKVSCGYYNTIVIADNKVYTFGWNFSGQLGHGHYNELTVPKAIDSLKNITYVDSRGNSCAIVADGKLYTFGCNKHGQLGHHHTPDVNIPTIIPNLENVTFVSRGDAHTAVVSNNKLYTFGYITLGRACHTIQNINLILDIPTIVPNLENIIYINCNLYSTAVLFI